MYSGGLKSALNVCALKNCLGNVNLNSYSILLETNSECLKLKVKSSKWY